jgi:hypothetical protein
LTLEPLHPGETATPNGRAELGVNARHACAHSP